MVFKPFGLVYGLVIIENWSSIGSRLMGLLTRMKNSLAFLVWYRVTKFAKLGLVKGRTFANPVTCPHPNYIGVTPPPLP